MPTPTDSPLHKCIVSVPLEVPNLPLPSPLCIEFVATFSYSGPTLLTGSSSATIHSLEPLFTSFTSFFLTLTSQLPLTSPILLSQIPPETLLEPTP